MLTNIFSRMSTNIYQGNVDQVFFKNFHAPVADERGWGP
jgi:hypothetical protein